MDPTASRAPSAPPREGATDVREIAVTIQGSPARVFLGGRGAPLLLVHGGWGGAALHWSSVWSRLAERASVVAPDLPGIGRTDQPALASVEAYARWLRDLLDALHVPRAWCVGNSFGASVVCRLASDDPDRCLGLVLVNGIAMPPSPPVLRWLGERPLGRRLLRFVERRAAYSPAAIARGFSDASKVPEELRRLVRAKAPPQVDAFARLLARGGSPPPRAFAPLLLFGADDRLPGTSRGSAERLRARWPGAKLVLVENAGHMPQVENPAAFTDALLGFIGERTT